MKIQKLRQEFAIPWTEFSTNQVRPDTTTNLCLENQMRCLLQVQTVVMSMHGYLSLCVNTVDGNVSKVYPASGQLGDTPNPC